jgi:hypothetical protein
MKKLRGGLIKVLMLVSNSNNRRTYADKFLKILTPQQVLKLFQTEGKMREKLLDKKNSN